MTTIGTRKTSRPSRDELAAAPRRRLRDVIADGLDVLFCGVNPGLYSGATGHHFARPGNRFWPALRAGGFTERLLDPGEDRRLLEYGLGLTNLVPRTTAAAAELDRVELVKGAAALARKVERHAPRWVAILGVGAYRTAFGRPKALLGPQEVELAGARVWVLPNPSGLNAHHQPATLAAMFRALRKAAGVRSRR